MSRQTRERIWIRELLEQSPRPLSPQEVVQELSRSGQHIGIATAYRNLRNFAEQGLLSAVQLPGGRTLFEKSGSPPHGHFHCEHCRKVYDLDPLPQWPSEPEGFQVHRFEVVMHGICQQCAHGETKE